MTLLAVRRPNLTLAGRRFERGETFDSTEMPQIDQHKWAQLIDHRIVDMIDKPGVPAKGDTFNIYTPDPMQMAAALVTAHMTCDCGYIASNLKGLKVHQGRKHKEP